MSRSSPPRFLFVQTNQRCNLRCTHCEYWKLNDDSAFLYLPAGRRRELLDEFAALGGEALVTCGGEPTLDWDAYLQLMTAARQRGLRALSVTNGSMILTRDRAFEMLSEGPSEVTVSLDHWTAAEHNRLRGRPYAWKQATRALRLLLDVRAANAAVLGDRKIYAMLLVSEDTWRGLSDAYAFALGELGVDKLKLNFAQPTFQHRGGGDDYFASTRIIDPAACIAKIRECDERWRIPRNPEWLRAVELYLRSVAKCKRALMGWANATGTDEAICNSYDRNIMVDLYGKARLCFSDRFPGVQLEKRGDLARFWYQSSLPIREQMVGCTQFCGVSHSVRKEPSTLRVLP